MICAKCMKAADKGKKKHPKTCECTCMHRTDLAWEDKYTVPRPKEKNDG